MAKVTVTLQPKKAMAQVEARRPKKLPQTAMGATMAKAAAFAGF